MGRVRQAGYLFRRENDTCMKHWCVVRDRSFIVYPFQPKIKNIRPDTDGSPIYAFPVEQLSVSQFVLTADPNGCDKTGAEYSLQLYYAKSGLQLVFYTDHAVTLEKWVNAIKVESSLDDLTPQDSPHGAPLPPEINSDPIPLSPVSPPLTSFGSSFSGDSFSEKYLESFDNSEKVKASEKIKKSHLDGKRKDRKLSKVKKISSMTETRSLSSENLSSLEQFSHSVEPPTTLSSPIRSSTSVMLSSKSSPKSTLAAQAKASFSRHQVIPPAHKRYKGGSELKRSPLALDHQDEVLDAGFLEQGFENEKKITSATISQEKINSSSKRHTICEMPDVDFLKQELPRKDGHKTKSTFYSNTLTLTKPFRQSIAPLSSLDFRLKQKKRKPILPFERYKTKAKDQNCADDSESSEDEDTCQQSSQLSLKDSNLIVEADRGNEFDDDFRSRDLPSNVILRHQQLKSGGLNMSLPNLKKVQEKSLMKVPSFEDSRKTSGSIGSRVLKRVSSAVGKRGKSEEDSTKSPTFLNIDNSVDQTQDDKDFTFKPSVESPTTKEAGTLPNDENTFVVIEGWLYRRKIVSWTKTWAALTSDRVLRFYKSPSNTSSTNLLFSINLSQGCSVEDITQSKNLNTFWLHPRPPNASELKLQSFFKEDDDRSKSIGKPIQLMCKSTRDFMHWMKEFLLLNSALFGGKNAVLPTPKHKLRSEERSVVDTKKQNGVNKRDSKELNNNWKGHVQDKDFGSSFSSTDFPNGRYKSYQSGSLEERVKSQSSLKTLDGSTSDEPFSSDEESAADSASPAIRVTLCDGRSLDDENPSAMLDIPTNGKNEEIIIGLETPLDKNKSKIDIENKHTHILGNALPTESSNKEMVTTSFIPAQTHANRSIINSEISISATGSWSNNAGAKNNIPPNESTGNESQFSDRCVEQLKAETSERQTTNKEPRISPTFSNEQFVANCDADFNCKICSNLTKNSQSCNFCDARNAIKRENKSAREESLSLKALDERTFTHFPFFSRSDTSNLNSSPASVVVDAAEQRSVDTAELAGGREDNPEKSNLELPAVIERIKLFESFASGTIKVGDLKVRENEENISEKETKEISNTKNFASETNLHLSPSLEKDLNTSSEIDRPNLSKFNSCSVENLRAPSSKEQYSLSVPQFDQLRRAASESNLLESNTREINRMKGMRKPIHQLSQIDFIEIYGMPKSLNGSQEQFLDIGDIPIAKRRNSVESDENSLPAKDVSEESSVASALSESKRTSLSNVDVQSPRLDSESGASEECNRNEGRANWLFNVKPKLRKSVRSGESRRRTSKEQVLQLSASQLKTASHRGYLNKRSKRKVWEKFWCVYQDACLYFYNSPHSDKTRDVIVLRGYEVIADVTKVNREKFEFRLQQEGSRSLYFSTNNFEEFLLWVGTLEKETRSIKGQERKSGYFFESFDGSTDSNAFHPSSGDSSSAPSPMLTRSLSHDDNLELEIVEMQKHKLLKELASQQEKLLEEQRVLDRCYGNETSPQTQNQERANATKRKDVIQKFDRVREQEEASATKSMAFLNRRRNSAQLKLDQMAKDLAPKSGKKRRDDHKHFAALEANQAEMKRKLSKIDKEIHKLQVNKQNALGKIQHRQDLALIIAEQQENLDILVRNNTSTSDLPRVRKRHQSNPGQKGLSSINEIHRASDSASSDSGSGETKLHRSKLTPFDENRSVSPPVFDDPSKDVHPLTILRSLSSDITSRDHDMRQSYSSDESLSRNPTSLSSSLYSLGSSTEFLNQYPSSSSATKRSKDQINPSVIAGIADFEKFSAKKLEKLKRNTPSSN